MGILSKLTLVIPTYNRHRFAERGMRYWAGREVSVHYLDGSAQPMDAAFLSSLAPNVHYHYLPIPILDRLAMAGSFVQSDYAVMLGDDEFFLPSGLAKCISVLESDGLVACVGRCLHFEVDGGRVLAEPWRPPHTAFDGYKLMENSPRDRAIRHMNPYLCTTIYGVMRSDIWKVCMAAAVIKTSATDAPEIGFEISSAYLGKSRVIDTLMWLRSGENPSLPQSDPRNLPCWKWYTNPVYESEAENFVLTIRDLLFPMCAVPLERIETDVRDAMSAYVQCENPQRSKLRQFASKAKHGALAKLRASGFGTERDEKDCFVSVAKKWNQAGVETEFGAVREVERAILESHARNVAGQT